MRQYQNYLRAIESGGVDKGDRTGTGTRSRFGHEMRFDLTGRKLPFVTTKKLYWEAAFHEMLWFLSGSRSILPLLKNDVSIWTDWSLKRFAEEAEMKEGKGFWNEIVGHIRRRVVTDESGRIQTDTEDYKEAKSLFERRLLSGHIEPEWADIGPGYGAMWRHWPAHFYDRDGVFHEHEVDQVARIQRMLSENPDSRRMLVSAWNPALLEEQALASCHYTWQVWTREMRRDERIRSLSPNGRVGLNHCEPGSEDERHVIENESPERALELLVTLRSSDAFLGAPYNIAQYGLLTHLLAHHAGMQAKELVVHVGDGHIYSNHQEAVETLLSREPMDSPTLKINSEPKDLWDYTMDDIEVQGYESHPPIQADVAV